MVGLNTPQRPTILLSDGPIGQDQRDASRGERDAGADEEGGPVAAHGGCGRVC